jgi:hypothetical protein
MLPALPVEVAEVGRTSKFVARFGCRRGVGGQIPDAAEIRDISLVCTWNGKGSLACRLADSDPETFMLRANVSGSRLVGNRDTLRIE